MKVRPHQMSKTTVVFRCEMIQLPVNPNDATTGRKLQGMLKDDMIMTYWPREGITGWAKKWECMVLSWVCSLDRLYILEPIYLEKSLKPTKELH